MADVRTSYLVPVSVMTPLMAELQRNNVRDILVERAIAHGIAPNADQLVVREALPNTDFATAAAVGGIVGNVTDMWLTQALTGGATVALATQTIVNAALAVTKVAGFYKVANQAAAPTVTRINFQVGAGASTRGVYQVESLYAEQAAVGYLSEPIIYDPNEQVFIQVQARAAAAGGERLAFGCLICEPKGPVISA